MNGPGLAPFFDGNGSTRACEEAQNKYALGFGWSVHLEEKNGLKMKYLQMFK